jgi:hypothetical protein
MIKEAEIAIVGAVTRALQLLEKDSEMSSEEIIKSVMSSVEAQPDAKIYAIASVNNAIKLKKHDPNMSDKQIIQQSVSDYKKFIAESSE